MISACSQRAYGRFGKCSLRWQWESKLKIEGMPCSFLSHLLFFPKKYNWNKNSVIVMPHQFKMKVYHEFALLFNYFIVQITFLSIIGKFLNITSA